MNETRLERLVIAVLKANPRTSGHQSTSEYGQWIVRCAHDIELAMKYRESQQESSK